MGDSVTRVAITEVEIGKGTHYGVYVNDDLLIEDSEPITTTSLVTSLLERFPEGALLTRWGALYLDDEWRVIFMTDVNTYRLPKRLSDLERYLGEYAEIVAEMVLAEAYRSGR